MQDSSRYVIAHPGPAWQKEAQAWGSLRQAFFSVTREAVVAHPSPSHPLKVTLREGGPSPSLPRTGHGGHPTPSRSAEEAAAFMEPLPGSLIILEVTECAHFADEQTGAQSGEVTRPSPSPGSGRARRDPRPVGLPTLLPSLPPLWKVCCGSQGGTSVPHTSLAHSNMSAVLITAAVAT